MKLLDKIGLQKFCYLAENRDMTLNWLFMKLLSLTPTGFTTLSALGNKIL